jgi:hypothetical protein
MAVVDHDYPLEGEMIVLDEAANPVEDVTIRIFDHTAFFAGDVDTWIGATLTDVDGKWVDPIVLDDGQSYVVHFQKLSVGGPNHVEITT